MERRFPTDFQKVKPYGNHGDRKCDGFHSSIGRVYQVYAPEKMSVILANAKIHEDFTGALVHWKQEMKEWVFVHNAWQGVPPDVLKKLLAVNGTGGVKVLQWCEIELRNEFFQMSDVDQIAVLGPSPSIENIMRLELRDVVVVANAIAQQEAPLVGEVAQVPAGKLDANSLSEFPRDLLTIGSRKSRLVKELFDKWHDPQLGDRIAATFRSKYIALRDSGNVGDELFHLLWQFAGGGSQKTPAHEAAVFALLSFLFEECEIFEPAHQGAIN
jgi:hypothetical protein